jgi:hypothetical protein
MAIGHSTSKVQSGQSGKTGGSWAQKVGYAGESRATAKFGRAGLAGTRRPVLRVDRESCRTNVCRRSGVEAKTEAVFMRKGLIDRAFGVSCPSRAR